uniref:Integrin_B_tail domain-containing protein n=1 Tax=Steinernema glaseri TaxID=37863 RepID=A0A1I7ZCY2_9BILA
MNRSYIHNLQRFVLCKPVPRAFCPCWPSPQPTCFDRRSYLHCLSLLLSACTVLPHGATYLDTNVCDNIKVGNEITFEVTLENTHCVDQRNFQIKIGPSGLDETLLVDVEVICDCDCEKEENIIRNAAVCEGGLGDLVCGICRCPPGRIGPFCECEADGQSTVQLDAKCKKTNESAICEGRGECKCGKCVCFPRDNNEHVSGVFCECDNFNCPRHNRKICSDHGTCDCGSCTCLPGWTGHACECPTSQDTCIAANGLICNGHGKCVCGKCICEEDQAGGRYSGPKCELCPTCPTKCVEYKPCVMCQMWQSGPYNDTQCAECPFEVIPVDELPVLNVTNNAESDECQFVDPADDCTFYYLYYYEPRANNITVWVNRHKNCPAPVPVLVIVLGVIAGIVLLGLLLLLLWKLLTVLADRAEFAKFENERLNARYDANENPIYKQATTTFMNPTYSKTSGVPPSKYH